MRENFAPCRRAGRRKKNTEGFGLSEAFCISFYSTIPANRRFFARFLSRPYAFPLFVFLCCVFRLYGVCGGIAERAYFKDAEIHSRAATRQSLFSGKASAAVCCIRFIYVVPTYDIRSFALRNTALVRRLLPIHDNDVFHGKTPHNDKENDGLRNKRNGVRNCP